MRLPRKLFLGLSIALLSMVSLVGLGGTSSAVTGSQFNAGNIISDSLFYNGNTMDASQIQTFLNSKVPVCETNHAETTSPNDSGRPYTCLKDFIQNTPSKAANTNCRAYPGGIFKASRIIYEVSRACGISQKVLLILLQKEQSLITDTWPWKIQYTKATGYGCPDSNLSSSVDANNNGCYDTYEGFFKQIYYSAWQYKAYKNSPGYYSYRAGRTSYIQWHPNAGCGGSYVPIQNHATAGLYNYTPYRPNQAALNNLYGTGNSCSSYGNRNFWRMYSDWFGSTHPKCTSNDTAGPNVYRLFSTKAGKHFYTAMQCEAEVMDATTSYSLEGVTFRQAPASGDDRTPVYRLKKKGTTTRYWTASARERDRLRNHGYVLEGTAFIEYKQTSTSPKHPVYRLYNVKTGAHLWTPSANERDRINSQPSWKYEGVAYYVYKP